MRKADFIIIIIVVLISVTCFTTYFVGNSIDRDNLVVEVYYQNELLTSFNTTEEINITLVSNNDVITINTPNGNLTFTSSNLERQLNYQIQISPNLVKVLRADCPNKYCTKMYLSPNHTTPIICTDGLMLKYKIESADIYA